MIARLEVTRGTLTECPLAEKTRNGWQNGVTFYPDAEVTKVTPLRVQRADSIDALVAYLNQLPSHIEYIPVSHVRDRIKAWQNVEEFRHGRI